MAQRQHALGGGACPEWCPGRDVLDAPVHHRPPRSRPDPRRAPRRFRPHLREWIQTCRWLLQEARRYHSEFVWEAVETHVSPFDILIGLSHLSSFEAALEDLARQHRLRLGSDDEASSSEDSAEL